MRSRRVRLPTGIALVRIQLPHRPIVFISRELEPGPRTRVAREAAERLAMRYTLIVLTTEDLDAAIGRARAKRVTSTLLRGRRKDVRPRRVG